MTRRTTEQVHADGGHDDAPVKSCELCQSIEPDAEDPAPVMRTTEAEPEPMRTTEAHGCRVCGRPVHHRRLCGAHYQTRRGSTAKEANRG